MRGPCITLGASPFDDGGDGSFSEEEPQGTPWPQTRMAGESPAIRTCQPSLGFPRHAGDQWLHVPHPPLLHRLQPPPDPTNLNSPWKANVENCLVSFAPSHFGQATRLRLEGTRFSKACAHASQMNS